MNEPVTLKIATVLQDRRDNLVRKLALVNRRIAKTQRRMRQIEEMMASHSRIQRQAA